MLNKSDILGAKDFEIVSLSVPEWGGDVCLRPFSARVQDKIEQIQLDIGNYKGSPSAVALAGSICDSEGKLLFSESDTQALAEKSMKAVRRVINKIVEINGITQEDLEDRVKN